MDNATKVTSKPDFIQSLKLIGVSVCSLFEITIIFAVAPIGLALPPKPTPKTYDITNNKGKPTGDDIEFDYRGYHVRIQQHETNLIMFAYEVKHMKTGKVLLDDAMDVGSDNMLMAKDYVIDEINKVL